MADPVAAATGIKLAGTAASGAIATMLAQAIANTAAVAPEPSLWDLGIVGIPLGMYGACIVASLLRTFRDPPQAEDRIVWKLTGVVADATFGGWLAVALMNAPISQEHIGSAIPPAVVGALFTLSVQFLRERVPKWIDAIMGDAIKEVVKSLGEILKSWLSKRGHAP